MGVILHLVLPSFQSKGLGLIKACVASDRLSFCCVEKCVRSPWRPVREKPPLWLLGFLRLLTTKLPSLYYRCESACVGGLWVKGDCGWLLNVKDHRIICRKNLKWTAPALMPPTVAPMWEGEHEKALSSIDSAECSEQDQRIWRENYPCTISSLLLQFQLSLSLHTAETQRHTETSSRFDVVKWSSFDLFIE